MISREHVSKSVNWMTGMLLTPAHFESQDRFVDGSVGWLLEHCVSAAGLVGCGVRAGDGDRGLARSDPKVQVHDDGGTVHVAVLEARGITPQGEVVDVSAPDVVRAAAPKSQLAGLTELLVAVVHTGEREEDPSTVGDDPANPNHAALRRPRHVVVLGPTADAMPHALVVGRIRRASDALAFEIDGRFIPPCATMLGHSSLFAAWERLRRTIVSLASDSVDLHRAATRYVEQIGRRGVDTRGDRDVLAFLERTVLALDACAYESLDPTVPPRAVFRQIDRAGRRIAVALDLSEQTRLFFRTLADADPTYATLFDAGQDALAAGWQLPNGVDLAADVQLAGETLGRLRQLWEALGAKYIDYRLNRAVDGLHFLLDKDGEHFYTAVATPGHPQRDDDELTFAFSQLSLAGRQEYRVVLLGDPHGVSHWRVGDELQVELRVNSASAPIDAVARTVACELPDQRNFAVNFDAPADAAAITSLQVTVAPGHRVRGAMLFQRRLGLVNGRGFAAPSEDVEPALPRTTSAMSAPLSGVAQESTNGRSGRPVVRFRSGAI